MEVNMNDTLRSQLSVVREEKNIAEAMVRLDAVKKKMRRVSWEGMISLMKEEEDINGYINRCIIRKGIN
jgi:hypothetical protein